MRFHTLHLLAFVVAAAFVLALCRHPETLWAAMIPLVGGLFVVLPVLGTVELLTDRESVGPRLGWGGVCLVCVIATIGSVLAVAVLSLLMGTAYSFAQ